MMPSILDDLTPQQYAAAVQSGPTLVIAGAGTGKTKTLIAAVAHRIQNDRISPNTILAVTFTNMPRVTIRDASFRRGPAVPSDFLADIPPENRVEGWLARARPTTSIWLRVAGQCDGLQHADG